MDQPCCKVSVKVLPKLKIARIIGKAVRDQRGDIRDVISIGKLVRKNDGPEDVEHILCAMIKYGEIKEHRYAIKRVFVFLLGKSYIDKWTTHPINLEKRISIFWD